MYMEYPDLLTALNFVKTPMAIHTTERGTIQWANDSIKKLWGTEDAVGKDIIDILKDIVPEEEMRKYSNKYKKVWSEGLTIRGENVPVNMLIDGQVRISYFDFEYKPLRNESGEIYCILHTAEDVTERYNREQRERKLSSELVEINEDLIRAMNISSLEMWSLDLKTGKVRLGSKIKKAHGIREDEDLNYLQSLEMLSSDNKDEIKEIVSNAIKTLGSFNIQYSVRPYGSKDNVWINSTGQVYGDENGVAKFVSGVMLDVTDQKLKEDKKNQFISTISHELKTPLTSLSLYIQMLYSNASVGKDPVLKNGLTKSMAQLKLMEKMVNDFLNISRIDSGRMLILKNKFVVCDMVSDVINKEMSLTAPTHNIVIEEFSRVEINADKEKVKSVILNLLSNATKFSPRDSKIEIRCIAEGKYVKISVKDYGYGIDKDRIEDIFKRYHNDNVIKPGFGVGLYVSSEIVHQHGGKIGAESETGIGSTFWFTLPIA